MKTLLSKNILILFIGGLTLFSSCRKEANNPIPDSETTTPGKTITTSIGGEVVDENGNAVSNATVTIGTKTMQTNTNGLFLFRDISVNENKAYIKVEKNGFFLGSRNLMTRENSVSSTKIMLLSNASVGNFSSTTGGIITHEGVSLNFPANSVNIEGGGIYNGTVNVACKFLDPNSNTIGEIMPGDLRALNTNGEERLLETFGMASIELTSPTGQKLNIADRKKVELSIPLSGPYLTDAPATIPLWYFDEVNGIWREEGSATKVGNNFVGEVSHFSFWNYDKPMPGTSIVGSVHCNNSPLSNIKITISNSSGRTLGQTQTDNLGNFSGLIPMNTALIIKVYSYNPCSSAPIYMANIGPFTSPVSLASIIACPFVSNSAQLKGGLIDCSGNSISNGVLGVNENGYTSYFFPDGNGKINTSLIYCSPTTVSLTGYDFSNIKSSIPQSFSTGPTINFGNLIVCNNNNINEYISYNLDGTNYSLFASLGDSLSIRYSTNFSPYYTYIDCGGANGIYCYIQGTTAGTFTMSNLGVNRFHSDTSTMMTTINTYGNIGSFISGTFSGTYVDWGGTNHSLNGSFNLKRKP